MPQRIPRTSLAARIAMCAAAAVTVAAIVAIPQVSNASAPLRNHATALGKTIGAAVTVSHLNESAYQSAAITEFNGLTPENEMKWDATEPSRGSFSYGNADTLVNLAQANGMKIRGHALVWHSQLAPWVNSVTSGTDLLAAMRNHISNVAGHFRGKIEYWDVVNEAFEGGGRRQSIFQQRIGNSYIEEAFRAARTADPAAKLCYNDFSTDGINAKSTAIFNMVSDFKARGVPIDCVGFQAHLIVNQVPGDFQANLQRFVNLGVDVNITELDIRMPTPPSAANLQAQANNYRTVVTACLAIARCTSITVWGITDRWSWIPDVFPNEGAALLLDNNYAKKSAYEAVHVALGGDTPTTPPVTTTTTSRPPTTPPTTTPPPVGGACSATYAQVNQWNTGFQGTVTVRAGNAAISGWTVIMTFPNGQGITQLWNGIRTGNGPFTVRNESYNRNVSANGTTTFGFTGTWTGTNSPPSLTCASP